MRWWNALTPAAQTMLMLYIQAKSGTVSQTYYGVGMPLPWPTDQIQQDALCRAYLELKEFFG